jgi:hypothetical protein
MKIAPASTGIYTAPSWLRLAIRFFGALVIESAQDQSIHFDLFSPFSPSRGVLIGREKFGESIQKEVKP